ncbi:MAG TPA: hypothetical protein VKX17_04460 [Planctomycetota bacterium]|nr:hypothetical protein [Planctomycetota bacterium]
MQFLKTAILRAQTDLQTSRATGDLEKTNRVVEVFRRIRFGIIVRALEIEFGLALNQVGLESFQSLFDGLFCSAFAITARGSQLFGRHFPFAPIQVRIGFSGFGDVPRRFERLPRSRKIYGCRDKGLGFGVGLPQCFNSVSFQFSGWFFSTSAERAGKTQ